MCRYADEIQDSHCDLFLHTGASAPKQNIIVFGNHAGPLVSINSARLCPVVDATVWLPANGGFINLKLLFETKGNAIIDLIYSKLFAFLFLDEKKPRIQKSRASEQKLKTQLPG